MIKLERHPRAARVFVLGLRVHEEDSSGCPTSDAVSTPNLAAALAGGMTLAAAFAVIGGA